MNSTDIQVKQNQFFIGALVLANMLMSISIAWELSIISPFQGTMIAVTLGVIMLVFIARGLSYLSPIRQKLNEVRS